VSESVDIECGGGIKPVKTFPVITELFIDRMAAIYVGETQIRVATNEGDQLVSTSWFEDASVPCGGKL